MTKKKKGFTLIELIVVIAIIAILAAVAVPRITTFTGSARTSSDNSNAKMLENVAKLIEGDTGTAPTDATFTSTYSGKRYLDAIPTAQQTGVEFYFNAGLVKVQAAVDDTGAAAAGGGIAADWTQITN